MILETFSLAVAFLKRHHVIAHEQKVLRLGLERDSDSQGHSGTVTTITAEAEHDYHVQAAICLGDDTETRVVIDG